MTSTIPHYQELKPCESLRPYVDCFWVASTFNHKASGGSRLIPPDGSMDLLIKVEELHGESQECSGFSFSNLQIGIFGVATSSVQVPITQRPLTLGVRFRPGRAHFFFKVPSIELRDQMLEADLIWTGGSLVLRNGLFRVHTIQDSIRVIESVLLSQLLKSPDEDSAVLKMIDYIVSVKGVATVEKVEELSGYGSRHLRRKFDRWLGLSPKEFCRVVRFQSLLRRIKAQLQPPWNSGATNAIDAGYFDQSHMIRDFRAFTGMTPASYFKKWEAMSDLSNILNSRPTIVLS